MQVGNHSQDEHDQCQKRGDRVDDEKSGQGSSCPRGDVKAIGAELF